MKTQPNQEKTHLQRVIHNKIIYFINESNVRIGIACINSYKELNKGICKQISGNKKQLIITT